VVLQPCIAMWRCDDVCPALFPPCTCSGGPCAQGVEVFFLAFTSFSTETFASALTLSANQGDTLRCISVIISRTRYQISRLTCSLVFCARLTIGTRLCYVPSHSLCVRAISASILTQSQQPTATNHQPRSQGGQLFDLFRYVNHLDDQKTILSRSGLKGYHSRPNLLCWWGLCCRIFTQV
jgi:hypothetical protein